MNTSYTQLSSTPWDISTTSWKHPTLNLVQRHENICLTKYHVMKTYRTVELQLQAFLISALDGGLIRDSLIGIALGYGLADRGSSVRFPAGAPNFLFTTVSRMALGPTQPPIQWVPGPLSLGIKRPGREADHSHLVPRSKNAWSYTSTPTIRLHGVVLIKN
jgi:hypothetical protein